MALPEKINILGIDYTVEEVECVNRYEPRKGEIDFHSNIIKIDRELPDDSKKKVLVHEIVHGIGEALGYDELIDDETKVQGLATALYQVFSTQVIFL